MLGIEVDLSRTQQMCAFGDVMCGKKYNDSVQARKSYSEVYIACRLYLRKLRLEISLL